MKLFFLIAILFFYHPSFSQNANVAAGSKCTDIIDAITEEWEKDSLGITGYRYEFFEKLKKCLPDNITKAKLFEKLGKPSRIQKVAFGKPWKNHIQYVYYIINIDSAGKLKPFQGLYIAFVFDETESYLEQIIDGDYCG